MKKKFALIMCAVMLFGAMFACIPASAEEASTAKTEGGPLAITEICYAPEDDRYEFVEVINVSNNEIDLKNYYVYRAGFSNGGTWHASGICQMFGYANQTVAKLVRLSLADVAGDTKLAKNEIAVIWFASANKDDATKDSRNQTVQDFKNYWTNRGVDMTNANIIKLPVYDAAGTNMYPCNNTTGVVGINGNSGTGFLPDYQAGFVIAMINKDFAATDVGTKAPDDYSDAADRKPAKSQARWSAADSVAFVLLAKKGATSEAPEANTATNTSAHFYNYVDEAKFRAGEQAATSHVKEEVTWARKEVHYLPAGLMTFERTDATMENVSAYWNNQAKTSSNAFEIVYPVVDTRFVPNPGTLYDGQMGLPGEIRVNDAANGVGSIVLNPSVKPVVENLAVINDEEPEETKAPETTAPETTAPAEEKKGCGSAIGVSALLVIAPAFAAGCVVSTKKRRK